MIYSFKVLQKYQLSQLILLVFLVIILVIGAVPGYITGKWSWENIPKITNLKDLKTIREDGLTIPGWRRISHKQIVIANQKWLLQTVNNENQSVELLLLIQNGPEDQPQVEWMDINGFRRWKTDSHQRVNFSLELASDSGNTGSRKQSISNIEARFFRGWTNQQTCAVMQWYAWPGGGSPEPGDWFWTDRLAMASKKRIPWVAVSILLPVEPLADIDPYLPQLESLGPKIQASLIKAMVNDPTL